MPQTQRTAVFNVVSWLASFSYQTLFLHVLLACLIVLAVLLLLSSIYVFFATVLLYSHASAGVYALLLFRERPFIRLMFLINFADSC
jgi:hypothetical protein